MLRHVSASPCRAEARRPRGSEGLWGRRTGALATALASMQARELAGLSPRPHLPPSLSLLLFLWVSAQAGLVLPCLQELSGAFWNIPE